MPSKQFEILLETLKQLRQEAEATSRALRVLEGQSGPMGPAGNTRTSYIRGIEQANANSPHSQSVGNLMPITVAAAAGAAAGRAAAGREAAGREASAHSVLSQAFSPEKIRDTLSTLRRYSSPGYYKNVTDNLSAAGLNVLNNVVASEERRTGPPRQRRQNQIPPHVIHNNPDYDPNPAQVASPPLMSPTNRTRPPYAMPNTSQSNIFSGLRGGGNHPFVPGGSYVDRYKGSGPGGFSPPPKNNMFGGPTGFWGNEGPRDGVSSAPWSRIGGVLAAAGGMILREALNTKNTKYRETYSTAQFGDNAFYKPRSVIEAAGLAVQRSIPQIASLGLQLAAGRTAFNILGAARTMGLRGAVSSATYGAGLGAGLGGAVASLGVGAIIYTGLQALPDAMENVKTAFTGKKTAEEYENSKKVMELRGLGMFRRMLNNLDGRTGINDRIENQITLAANRIAQRSGGYFDVSALHGTYDNEGRQLLSWLTLGAIKGRKELRAEAEKELVDRDKRIEGFRVAGWEAMMNGDFNKARGQFNQAFDGFVNIGVPLAWKDPMQIYSAIQAAKISSRHYAASFITRPVLRTGD